MPSSSSQKTPGARRTVFNWERGTVYYDFLIALSDHVRLGKRADSSFKKQTWVDLHTLLVAKGHEIPSWETLKTKNGSVKRLYRDWVALCNASGFGHDEITGTVTASDECWEAYIAVGNDYTHEEAVSLMLLETPYTIEMARRTY
jgi:hypothetical protein